MNIVILGDGTPPVNSRENEYPAILCDCDGVPMIERVIEDCKLLARRIAVTVRLEDCIRFHLDSSIKQLLPEGQVVSINRPTAGTACSALMAACQMDQSDELLILGSNEIIDIDFVTITSVFRAKNYDAGTVTFKSIHPRHAFVQVTADGVIVEASEKRPISKHATAGFYWFKSTKDFVQATLSMIRKDAHIEGKFYVCPVLNQMILFQKTAGIYPIGNHQYRTLYKDSQSRGEGV